MVTESTLSADLDSDVETVQHPELREIIEIALSHLTADATLRDLIDGLEDMESFEEGLDNPRAGVTVPIEELIRRTAPCATK